MAFRALLKQFKVKEINPSLSDNGSAKGIGKDGQIGIQIKVMDSDDPATEEFIRKVLRENGQTKKEPGDVKKQSQVQPNHPVRGLETIGSRGTDVEIQDHKEEPVFIKFIEIENEDSERDIIEKILKSQNPESFNENQDFLKLEGDDSPWKSLHKNNINTTQNLIDANIQSSEFSRDIIRSSPKLVSFKSSAPLVSSKSSAKISSSKLGVTTSNGLEQNVKRLKTLDEEPCQMRMPRLQEVENAMSTMIFSLTEKPKARVVLEIIKTINSKSDEDRRHTNTVGVKTLSKSSADTEDTHASSDKFSSIEIKGGKIVENKDGFIVADSTGSEQDVRVQVLYLGEPETEAFINSVLQMDESELRKNTKFTILKDSQDLKKDLQLEVIDNERLKKLVKYEQPIESSDVARDWFNLKNITKTTVQILKPKNGKQKQQHGTQPQENDSKITHLQGEKLQKEKSNSLDIPLTYQETENKKITSNEKLQEIKSVNQNFKKVLIGVHKIDTIEAASSIKAEEKLKPNNIRTKAKPSEESYYSESVLELPKNSTNDEDESSNEIDQWLENTSLYGTDSFSDKNFTTPQYKEEDTYVPTTQKNRFDVNDINSDGVPKALFFNVNYTTKPNYEEADEPEMAKENQDMYTAESSGYPRTFILQPPKKENVEALTAKNIKEDALKTEQYAEKTRKDKGDPVKVQQDKDVAAKSHKYKETVVIPQKDKEAIVNAQRDREIIVKANVVKETASKHQESYGNVMKELGVRNQDAEDEEKLIEAALNFEQKYMVSFHLIHIA